MSGVRLLAKNAVFTIIEREGMVLMLLRQNTGYMDGMWTFPSGHVEPGEFPSDAGPREAFEEAGVEVPSSQPAHIMYRKKDGDHHPYVDFYFVVHNFEGEPHIPEAEREKCAELKWFPKNQLPENIVPYLDLALSNIANGIMYSEVVEPN